MSRYATIVIPDISGFTNFIATTELSLSAGVLCELLNELIGVTDQRYTVAEVEGDAVLFYAPDKAIPVPDLLNYAQRAFNHFHTYLATLLPRLPEGPVRQAAANLTVKFICHYGEFVEINIRNFKKPVGLEIVTAHRLLKNQVPSNEYLLITKKCWQANAGGNQLPQELDFTHHSENLDKIGNTPYYWKALQKTNLVTST